LLTLIKESYLFLTNSYGFLVHPYRTIKKVNQDRSQKLIFLFGWLGAWFSFLLLIAGAFLITFLFPHFFWLAKLILVPTIFLVFLLFGLTIWWFYWWLLKKRLG